MDHFSLNLFLLCTSIFLIFAFLTRQKLSSQKNKLPPGRTGWPIVGEMWDYVMAIRRGAPEKFVNDRMAKHSPDVFKTRMFGENMALVCGPAGNKFLFSNENKSVISWWPYSVNKMFGSNGGGSFFLQLRGHAIEFLKPEFLREYVSIMDSLGKQHVETNWSPHQEVKVYPLSKMHTITVSCRLLLNVKDKALIKRLEDLYEVLMTGLISTPIDLPGTSFNRAVKSAKLIREEILLVIKKRKKELQENVETSSVDMLTRMLQQQEGDDETLIANELMALLIGSYETTSSLITLIIYYLEKNPHIYRMVFQEQMAISKSKSSSGEWLTWGDMQEMKYSWWVACEAMRLAPPASGSFREVIVDHCQFAGFTIPRGWKIHWMPQSTHRDPKYFPNPENFDPLRFEGSGVPPFSFVPFGGGPRMCPGKEFARVATLTFIHNVVTKFNFKSVNPHEKIIYSPGPKPLHGLSMQLRSV